MSTYLASIVTGVRGFTKPSAPHIDFAGYAAAPTAKLSAPYLDVVGYAARPTSYDSDSESESESDSDSGYPGFKRELTPPTVEYLNVPVDQSADLIALFDRMSIQKVPKTPEELADFFNELTVACTTDVEREVLATTSAPDLVALFGRFSINDDHSSSSSSSPGSTSTDASSTNGYAVPDYSYGPIPSPSPPRYLRPLTARERWDADVAVWHAAHPPFVLISTEETQPTLLATVAEVTPLEYPNAYTPASDSKEQALLSKRAKRAAAPAPVVKVTAAGDAVGRRSQYILREAVKGAKRGKAPKVQTQVVEEEEEVQRHPGLYRRDDMEVEEEAPAEPVLPVTGSIEKGRMYRRGKVIARGVVRSAAYRPSARSSPY